MRTSTTQHWKADPRTVTDDEGKLIISIEQLLERVQDDQHELIWLGYEQSRCNNEGLVDMGDAIRQFIEDKYSWHVYNRQTLRLYGVLLQRQAEPMWKRHFPGDVNPEVIAERRAVHSGRTVAYYLTHEQNAARVARMVRQGHVSS